MVLKEDIHRFISTTELFLSDIRGLRNTGLKKVNFFVGHPVDFNAIIMQLENAFISKLIDQCFNLLKEEITNQNSFAKIGKHSDIKEFFFYYK